MVSRLIGCPSLETEYPSRCDGHSRQAAEATVNGHSLNRLSESVRRPLPFPAGNREELLWVFLFASKGIQLFDKHLQ